MSRITVKHSRALVETGNNFTITTGDITIHGVSASDLVTPQDIVIHANGGEYTVEATVSGANVVVAWDGGVDLPAADYYIDLDVIGTDTPGVSENVADMTDNSGGTASTTLAAMTVTTPADLAAVAAQLVIIRNAIASLAAQDARITAALIDAGLMASA